MNSCTQYGIANATELAVSNYGENDFGGLSDLRQILSRQGLYADEAQEQTLLELIQQSIRLKR